MPWDVGTDEAGGASGALNPSLWAVVQKDKKAKGAGTCASDQTRERQSAPEGMETELGM